MKIQFDTDNEKITQEQIQDVSNDIKIIFNVLSTIKGNLGLFKKVLASMEEETSAYEAFGITDLNDFFKKDKRNRAEVKRLKAIVSLLEVIIETEEVFVEN